MKHCEHFRNLLALHVEGDLTGPEGQDVERHLEGCRDCRNVLAGLVESQSLFREVRGEGVPDDVVRGVRHRVLDRIGRNPREVLGWPVRIERAVMAGFRRPVAVATASGLARLIAAALLLLPSFGPAIDVPPDEPAMVEMPDPPETPRNIPSVAIADVDPDPEVASAMDESPIADMPDPQPAVPVIVDWNPDPVEIDIPPQRTVKLVTDDPKVIIYWVLDEFGEGNEGGGA